MFEDTAAIAGLLLALGGLILRQLTGSGVWDGSASIAIGVLLVLVALRLGRDSRDLLIGRAADDEQLRAIRAEIEGTPGVDPLVELLTATTSAPGRRRRSPTGSIAGWRRNSPSPRTCSSIPPAGRAARLLRATGADDSG